MKQFTNNELLTLFEHHIAQMPTPEEPQRLYAPIKYGLEVGGKRIRPTLLMLVYNLYAEDIDRALMPAMAVEIFHNFTLLHDDIMDNAAVRRGRPSVPAKWGDNVAILSGDAMLILAYNHLQRTNSERLPKIFEWFNKMAAEVCEGQQFDMDFETQAKVSVVDYMRMIELKTAALLAGSAIIGAILAGASESDCKHLYDFAREVGLAFQLQDDYLDVYGNPDVFGKKIGGDILCNKKTFMLINALRHASAEERNELQNWIECKNCNPDEKIQAVTDIFSKIGVDKLAQKRINEYSAEAETYLNKVNLPEERKQILHDIARKLMGRQS